MGSSPRVAQDSTGDKCSICYGCRKWISELRLKCTSHRVCFSVISLLLSSLRVPVGVLWATLLSCVWLWLLEVPDPDTMPYYGPAVVLFAWSGVQELLVEPFWVLSQAYMFVHLKVVAESLAMIAKCTVTVVMVVLAREWGLYIFCAAHVSLSALCVTSSESVMLKIT